MIVTFLMLRVIVPIIQLPYNSTVIDEIYICVSQFSSPEKSNNEHAPNHTPEEIIHGDYNINL